MSPQAIVYQWITRGVIRALGGIGLALGLAMVIGGPARFASPGFATARLVPGGVTTWGIALALAGAITLAGVLSHWRRDIVLVGLFAEFLWFLFFAVSLAFSTFATPQGAVTGPFAYGGYAIICVVAAAGARDLAR